MFSMMMCRCVHCGVAKPKSSLGLQIPPPANCRGGDTCHLLEGQCVLGHPTCLLGFKARQGQLLQEKIPVGLFCPAQTFDFFPSQRQFVGGGFRHGMP